MKEKKEYKYRLKPQDYIFNCVMSLPLHGRAGLGWKIACVSVIATSVKKSIILIHGPIGCAFRGKINPCRGWNPIYDMPCTALTEAETVFGAQDKLVGAIEEVYEKYKPELIWVVSTDVSEQIGEYMDSVRSDARVPCEVVVCQLVSCEQDAVRRGYFDIWNALITQVLENVDADGVEKDEKSINIATLIQFTDRGEWSREFKFLMEDMGLSVNGFYFANNTVDDIKSIPKAPVTVVNYGGEQWSDFLEQKYGMKYIEQFPEHAFTSFDSGPYGLDGVDRLLLTIGTRYGVEGEAEEVIKVRRGEAEEALERPASALRGKSLSVVGSFYGGIEADLIKYCGMKCGLVILRFETGSNLTPLLSDDAKERIAEMWLDFCSKYGSEPEILIEPTLEEELEALKKIKPDLVIPSLLGGTGLDWYEKHGFKTLAPSRLFSYFFGLGYWTVVGAAKEARRALERPCSSRPLLSMLEYDAEYGDLTKQWADNARIFKHVWYEAI